MSMTMVDRTFYLDYPDGQRRITSVAELDQILDEIFRLAANDSPGWVCTLHDDTNPWGQALAFGVNSDYGFVQFHDTKVLRYAVGDLDNGTLTEYWDGHGGGAALRPGSGVPLLLVRLAAVEFVATDEMPTGIDWVEGDPRDITGFEHELQFL